MSASGLTDGRLVAQRPSAAEARAGDAEQCAQRQHPSEEGSGTAVNDTLSTKPSVLFVGLPAKSANDKVSVPVPPAKKLRLNGAKALDADGRVENCDATTVPRLSLNAVVTLWIAPPFAP